ncbi:MAG: MurR/RpiR family transcriptional regulator [Blautia sp.]|nr:MurR/RpiR family transcriptional regulator [Blautia sp.]
MPSENLVSKIQSAYPGFTRTEKKVADYVLKNQKKVLYMSITDLADACQVGDTSVYRFCRTLNLQGYQEFKLKLSLGQRSTTTQIGVISPTSNAAIDDSLRGTADRVLQIHTSALRETYSLLDQDRFVEFLRLIEDSRRVYFFGIGDSLLSAQEACNKFMRIAPKVYCLSDPHMQSMAAATMTEEDFLVIVSYSGSTKDNIHVAKIAKKAGAKLGCITRFAKSPLASYCDAILLCGSDEGPLDGGSIGVKVSQLFLIDLLYQEYYNRNYDVSIENNQKASNAVLDKLF